MKTTTNNTRRQFIGALALGATASTISVLTNPLYADVPIPDTEKLYSAEDWFKKIKGKHRIVYDGSMPHHGFPIIWNWAFYFTNNGTGTPDEDMTAMTVLRHKAIAFAFNDALWQKYNLGKMFNVNTAEGTPYTRNPYYIPQEGDFPLPMIEGLKRMQERGALFCVCDLAMKVFSNAAAIEMGLDSKAVYEEWIAAILPDIQLVPSGVWALGRAQEHGCGYIFAGE